MMMILRNRTMGQIDISAAVVTAANQTYTGIALTPTPTVVLDGETIPSTGYDVTYSNNTNAGTATITITGKDDYVGTATGTFIIAKANPVYVAPTANNRTYNTSSAALLVAGSNTTPGTFTYCATQSGTYSTTIPSQTNAGTYTTYWKFTPTDTNNYNSVGATAVSTTISPKTVSSPTITLSQSTYTYSGSACQPTPTVKDGTTTIPSSEYTVSYGNNVNVGTATVTITDKSGGNYTISGSTTFTITKANASVTAAPTAKTGQTYNGSAKTLVNAGTASGGTMYYYATTTNSKPSSTTSFTTTIPTKTNAGTYYVWYYVKGDSNHNNTAISSTSVSVTIAKANRTISFTTAPTWVGTGKTVTVAASPSAGSGDGAITYTSGSTSKATISGSTVTGVSEGSVTITATIAAGTNYNSATTSYSMTVVNSANYVDLGLPSGTVWAKFNVDVAQSNGFATSEYERGSYFSWGNTDGHNTTGDGILTTIHFTDVSFTQDTYNATSGASVSSNIPLTSDAANVNLGGKWKMPSEADFRELWDNCTITTINEGLGGKIGMIFTSNINGNVLVLPAAGYGYESSLSGFTSIVRYWSLTYSNATYAKSTLVTLSSYTRDYFPANNYRRQGLPVRAIIK